MKTAARLLLLLAALPLLAGCWDARPLDRRAFVVLVGLDRTAAGRVRLTAQTPLSRPEQAPPKGGGGGAGQSDRAGFRVMVGEGESYREAFEQARAGLARELDLTLMDALIIGEGAAQRLAELESIARSPRVPIPGYIAIARGNAEPLVRARSPGLMPPGEYLKHGFSRGWTRSPAVVPMTVWKMFNRNYYTPLEDPYAQAVTARRYGLNWDGLAVYREHRFAGFLSEREATIFNLVKEQTFEGTITARVEGRPEAIVAMKVSKGKARLAVRWRQGVPELQCRVNVSGDLAELRHWRLLDSRDQAEVEVALSRTLAGQVSALLRHLQDLGSDPLGFGELMREADPYRPEVQSGRAWHAAYRRARLDVLAAVKVISSGLTR